jgi:hypothetical protein
VHPLSIALALLVSVVDGAGAQQTPVCTTDTSVYNALKPVIERLIAGSQPVVTDATTSKPTTSAAVAPSTTSASAAAATTKLVTTKAICSLLRSAVADREAKYPQGVNLKTASWTFVEVGNYYGVYLETRIDPALGIVANQRSPVYVFTKESRPKYIKLMYL